MESDKLQRNFEKLMKPFYDSEEGKSTQGIVFKKLKEVCEQFKDFQLELEDKFEMTDDYELLEKIPFVTDYILELLWLLNIKFNADDCRVAILATDYYSTMFLINNKEDLQLFFSTNKEDLPLLKTKFPDIDWQA